MLPHDAVVEKLRFSAFHGTNLDDLLRTLACDEVCLVGYSADVCVRFTAVDAYNRGYRVTLIDEGFESFKELKQQAIDYLQWLIDAQCISVEEYASVALPS